MANLDCKMSRFWLFFRHCLQVSKAAKIWHRRPSLRYQEQQFIAPNMNEILYFWKATSCEQFPCLQHTSFPKFGPCISPGVLAEKKICRCFAEARYTYLAKALQIVRRFYSCIVFLSAMYLDKRPDLPCAESLHTKEKLLSQGEGIKARNIKHRWSKE